MGQKSRQSVLPVTKEEVHADAGPVESGGVRVTKHVEGHDELLEQELRKGHVQIRRVRTHRVVDGPQPVQHVGNTFIVPVVSEVLRVEKQWVITEEIHITQTEEHERVHQKVRVNEEQAEVEQLDERGHVTGMVEPPPAERTLEAASGQNAKTGRLRSKSAAAAPSSAHGTLSKSESVLKDKSRPKR